MITSEVVVENILAALRGGAYDFIGKPIHLEELQVTIRNGIEAQALRKEVGTFRRGQQYWIVAAQPFDPPAAEQAGDVAGRVLALVNQARAQPRTWWATPNNIFVAWRRWRWRCPHIEWRARRGRFFQVAAY